VATTQIEGNTLTEEEVFQLLEGKATIAESREYQKKEVDNIVAALNRILKKVLDEDCRDLISPQMLQGYHREVGEGIGETFRAVPGQFRRSNVTVANYKPPSYSKVPTLVSQLCKWLDRELHYKRGDQLFWESVIQAIVAHVYIAWIHPFSDGNGRTARLVEYYLLLRAGVPDIASHVLSNHYNLTRDRYYIRLRESTESGDISGFIRYAVTGFRDGLLTVLQTVQMNQMEITWGNYVREMLDVAHAKGSARDVIRRRRRLALETPDGLTDPEAVIASDPDLVKLYRTVSERTIQRDIEFLEDTGLIEVVAGKVRGRREVMSQFMAVSSSETWPESGF
jgi:Fic family protein